MAELHGNQGTMFYRSGYISASTIAFVDGSASPDTITDSGSGFVAGGFVAGTIEVSSTSSNDSEYTVSSVATGVLTLDAGDALSSEGAGAAIIQMVPGVELGGFFNWSLNHDGEVHDITDFGDGTVRTFKAGLTTWTATAERWWLTGGASADTDPAVGAAVFLRMFTVYTAAPNTTTNYYYEGSAIVTNHSPATPVDGIVQGSLSFQGTDTLTLVTRTTAWG
jgi:hypothetical protein